MMFEKITPEAAGIPSGAVEKYLNHLEKRGVRLHSLLLMKGDKLYGEYYWAPFDKYFCHRMYSQTKSYTAVAIGLLEEEGKLSIYDPISKYFDDRIDTYLPEQLREQTIREMLTMTTVGECAFWFNEHGEPDRTHLYFNKNRSGLLRRPGTVWDYDSAGSQVLSSLVEKLSGMTTFDYLNEKIFRHLGTFKTATMLRTRNGDSWGDSALVCTPRDMASFARFVMNYGVWDGKRLMNEKYLRDATAKQVDNSEYKRHGSVYTNGYGYQIWRCEQNSFSFHGMGSQLTVCTPDKDLIMVCTGDTQGSEIANDLIISGYFDLVVDSMQQSSLPENSLQNAALESLGSSLTLRAAKGMPDSPFRAELSGREYLAYSNPMGISRFSFVFSEDGGKGELRYTNAQGEKVIPFGVNHNVFASFPELGYSNDFGGLRTTDGFMYKDAVSMAWLEEKKLVLSVQIIDRYFGNVDMYFAFKDDEVTVLMKKCAEDFLDKYDGQLIAKRVM
ncbi:MAG: serine hydrolase [Clostridia bacterium]|nr:serine hydrolase [Clostridia bacterium]